MSPKLWRAVPLAVVIGGCLLSGMIARQLWHYEQEQWETRVRAETTRLSESLHEWMENAYLPLSSLATLVEMSPGIEENIFLNAVDSLESRATSVAAKQVALFEFRQEHWDRRASTIRGGDQHLLDPDSAIGGPGLLELLDIARERPNEWKMSQPVQGVAGSADVRVALALTAMPEIVVVGTVDLERVTRSLLATRAPSGIVPQLYFDRPGGDPLPLLTIPAPEVVATTIRTAIATSGRVMAVEWRVSPTFGGGIRKTAGWTALGAGSALSMLMGLLLWRQLLANLTIRRRVDEATAALQGERAQLQSLLDSAPVGVAITVDGKLRFANPQMAHMSTVRLGGLTSELFLRPQQREEIVERLETEQVVHNVPVQMNSATGQTLDVLLTVMNHEFDGQPAYLAWLVDVTSVRDVERAMAEAKLRAEDATRSKSHFLANMSHEIRTPMNAIIGMSHLALQFELAAKPRNYVDKVHRAAVHLLGIINDILDFSKIEADKMVLEAVDFPLDEVMEHLANLVGLKAQQGGLELHFDMRCDLPARLVGDPLRLGQVLINLGNNAIKFTQQGDVVIGVEEVMRDDHEVELHFKVRDSGIGMSEEQCAQLFQAFSQADASTTRKYGGTGLGLAISKRLVELMGGRIWVESQLGAGSTFHFTVRLGLVADAAVSRMFHAEELRGMRTLVVDDNAVARDTLATLIGSFGMQAHTVASSEEAWAQAAAQQAAGTPYALAFVDWRMPGTDGISCAAGLQQRQPAGHAPPVVLMAPYGRDDDVRAIAQSRGVHVQGVMVKPFTPSTLLESIGIALDKTALLDRRTPVRVAQDQQAQAQLRGARLLLVEDNAMNQELALALLEGAGIEVMVANDGAEALRMLAEEPAFDGVLMDCQMPVMDGFAATRELRQNPAWATLPVIAMTANAMAGDREMVLAVGMNDHIAKPINVTEMFATIARWVRPARPAAADGEMHVAEGAAADALKDRRSTPRGADNAELPALEGIDTRAGLARTMNNPQLYRRLLARFLEGQGGFAQRFDEALSVGDFDTARRDAHTLKGTAGSIGAQAVADAAAEVERLCEQATAADVLAAAMQKAQQALGPVLAGLRAMVESAAASSPATEAPAGLDTARVNRLLQGIHMLLKDSDAQSIEAGEELLQLCRASPWAASASDLKNALDGYDFDRALELTREFIAQLQATEIPGEAAPVG